MKDITRPYMVRLYARHLAMIKKSAKKNRMKDSEFVRHAIEACAVK